MTLRESKTSRLAVDIGGTFTDIFLIGPEGETYTKKILSTSQDYSQAVADGVAQLLSETGIPPASIKEVLHGTTIVTNTCIELTGARVGLITTKGFRDVLEIGRGRMPRLYDLTWTKPPPLVPRYLRFEVDERIDKDGKILRSLNLSEVDSIVDRLLSHGVESIAVCLYNSPLNPVHEELIGQRIQQKAPKLHLSLSTGVMPLIKEYERTCETVVNAYVMPVVSDYIRFLKKRLIALGIDGTLFIMQSNGGMITAETSAERPVEIVECGPAGGVVGAAFVAKSLGFKNVITLDLGGTTAKASIVEEGQFTRSAEYEVGAGIHMSSRLRKGNGYVLRVPSIDIAEIGAGGGSIIGLDSGGMLKVGPRSAGAMPGPACYNRGGTEPCLTDCYLVLGYLNPDHLLGGDFKLDPEKSYRALEKVARPLKMDPVQVAYAAYRVANSNMTRAITAVSSERGRDPRKFILLVFGGAGPLHGAEVAGGLGIKQVIIAPYPGIFSAFGFACGDIERYWIQGFKDPWGESVIDRLTGLFRRLTDEATSSSREWGYATSEIEIQRFVDLRYLGQASELSIPLPKGTVTVQGIHSVRKAFDQEHHKTFGHSFQEKPVEVASIRLVSRVPLTKPSLSHGGRTSRNSRKLSTGGKRKGYFGEDVGFVETSVLTEADLGITPKPGPVLVEKYDTTIVVPPNCEIYKATGGCLMINISAKGMSR